MIKEGNRTLNQIRDKSNIGLLFIFIVIGLIFSLSYISFVYADELRVTIEHPFLINGKWIPASQLQIGDYLTSVDGKKIRIKNITDVILDSPVKVYNLEANPFNDFIVDGIVVHNSHLNLNIGKPNYYGFLTTASEYDAAGNLVIIDYPTRTDMNPMQNNALAAIADTISAKIKAGEGKAVIIGVTNECGDVVGIMSYFESPLSELYSRQSGLATVEFGRFAAYPEPLGYTNTKKIIYDLVIDGLKKCKEKAIVATNFKDAAFYKRVLKGTDITKEFLEKNPEFCREQNIVRRRYDINSPGDGPVLNEAERIELGKLAEKKIIIPHDELWYQIVPDPNNPGQTLYLQYRITTMDHKVVLPLVTPKG